MSSHYQQFLRSTSNPVQYGNNSNNTPSPPSSLNRKPANPANTISPLRNTSGVYGAVTQPGSGSGSSSISTTLSSFPKPLVTHGPTVGQPLSSHSPRTPSASAGAGYGQQSYQYQSQPQSQSQFQSQSHSHSIRSTPSTASIPKTPSNDVSVPMPVPIQTKNASVHTPQTSSTAASSSPSLSSTGLKPLTPEETDNVLSSCLDLQSLAVNDHSRRPFAALLLGADNKIILASHFSLSHFQHAESELARLCASQYSSSYLARCTLVSTWEPCAMCAGTIYWSGIGRLLYAASEQKLVELTGSNNKENMTMSLPCRTVLSSGQNSVEVVGPVDGTRAGGGVTPTDWEGKVVEESEKWWKLHQPEPPRVNGVNGRRGSGGYDDDKGSTFSQNGSLHVDSRSNVSVYNPEESTLGSIGEDGEYQADLKIDWMM